MIWIGLYWLLVGQLFPLRLFRVVGLLCIALAWIDNG